ncbi:MAG: hypothetical protein JWM53_669 [bacterium]|nr:hypothetical protein [bacterium]
MRRLSRAATLVILAGCGYTSQYRPPADGRARPLWRQDHVENDLGQIPITRACVEAIYATTHPEPPRARARAAQFWIPPPATPPVARVADRGADDYEAASFVDPFLTRGFIAMVLLLPILDIVFAADRPELEHFSAEAIDDLNAYNDLARRAGTPCSQRAP